jgi:hypothetical protein
VWLAKNESISGGSAAAAFRGGTKGEMSRIRDRATPNLPIASTISGLTPTTRSKRRKTNPRTISERRARASADAG